jgi:hypothetical protein
LNYGLEVTFGKFRFSFSRVFLYMIEHFDHVLVLVELLILFVTLR